jgi:hypothetical protein
MKKQIFLFVFFLVLANVAFAQSTKLLTAHPWRVDPVSVDEQIAIAGEDEAAIEVLEKMKNQVFTFTTKKKINSVVITNDGSGTWELQGTSLTVTINGERRQYRIIELTGARLVVRPAGSDRDIVMVAR